MFSSAYLRSSLLRMVGIGTAGFFGGVCTERFGKFGFGGGEVKAAGSFSDYSGVGGAGGKGGGNLIIPVDGGPVVQDGSYMAKPTKPTRASQIMRFGFPGMDNIRSFNDFVISYDQRNRVPHWVFEHLTRSHVKHNPEVDRGKCDFYEDFSIHKFFRSTNQDYKGSGYDRGHLAAAGNHRLNQEHVSETFVLSNIAPQVGKGFNRDAWNRLEKYVRGLTKKYENVYVCSGPLYLPRREPDGKYYVKYEVIGQNNVAVPTHFFKVVVCEESPSGHLDLEAFVMPNKVIDDEVPVTTFRVPLESIEKAAGLLFCDRIPRGAFRQINGRKN